MAGSTLGVRLCDFVLSVVWFIERLWGIDVFSIAQGIVVWAAGAVGGWGGLGWLWLSESLTSWMMQEGGWGSFPSLYDPGKSL
jgi:hypothetical protein